MKHKPSVTAILLVMFLLAQMIGLMVLQAYADPDDPSGYRLANLGGVELERPETSGNETIGLIAMAVLIGTAIIFLFMKFNLQVLWRLWFTLAIAICVGLAIGAWIPQPWPLWLGIIIAIWRVFRPNPIVHNLSELFVYGGLAVIFVPLLDVNAAILLLVLFSVYDAYAVWKSKHMIKLASFQAKSKMFAGMVIPYALKKATKGTKPKKRSTVKTAILGGGDVGFPLFFAGTLLPGFGYLKTLLIPLMATVALGLLFTKGKKNQFYPAMPFLTTGCLIGYGILLLL